MSGLDIAELTGKQHGHVMRDIKRMLEDLDANQSKFGAVYRDAKGEQRPCFHLPKDLTMTLCASRACGAGYSTPLRHRIVTRWMELAAPAALEQAATKPAAPAIPSNMIEACAVAPCDSQTAAKGAG